MYMYLAHAYPSIVKSIDVTSVVYSNSTFTRFTRGPEAGVNYIRTWKQKHTRSAVNMCIPNITDGAASATHIE